MEARLLERLHSLGLTSVTMKGDGSCQFRTVADQLFGSQEHHACVRAVVVQHMRECADWFGMFFDEADGGFDGFLASMAVAGTWGDELTLAACVEAFGCVAHVVQSTEANWYMVYKDERGGAANADSVARTCTAYGLEPPRVGKEIFLAYIAPIHYNAIGAQPTVA